MGEHIVLGFGNSIDYEIIWNSHIFEQLIATFRIKKSEICNNNPINSVRDLIISILGFLKDGAGGERFVATSQIIEDFAAYFEKKITIGGTSARAAVTIRKLGYTSALHLVTINDYVRKLIPHDCPWVCSNQTEHFYPHLIIQFNKHTKVQVGEIKINAVGNNRIIYVNDPDNMMMKLNPDIALLASNAKVFLVSGFNAMQSSELLNDRMLTLRSIIKSLPSETLVLYEDACFHKPALSKQIRDALLDLIDIYSMNAEEFQGHLGRKINLLSPDEVIVALRDIHRLMPVPLLVIHTKHWALAFGSDASQYAQALKGGIVMATTRLRYGDEFSDIEYLETEKLPEEPKGADFALALERITGNNVCCLPSLKVKENKVTTVGLGDAFVGGFLLSLVQNTLKFIRSNNEYRNE